MPNLDSHSLTKLYRVLGSTVALRSEDFKIIIDYVKRNAFVEIEGCMWANTDLLDNTNISRSNIYAMLYVLVGSNILLQNSLSQNWVCFNYNYKISKYFYYVICCDSKIDRMLESEEATKNEYYRMLGTIMANQSDIFVNIIHYVKYNATRNNGGYMWANIIEWKNENITPDYIRTMVYILVKCNILIRINTISDWVTCDWVRFNYNSKNCNCIYNVIYCLYIVGRRSKYKDQTIREIRGETRLNLVESKQKITKTAAQQACDEAEFASIADI